LAVTVNVGWQSHRTFSDFGWLSITGATHWAVNLEIKLTNKRTSREQRSIDDWRHRFRARLWTGEDFIRKRWTEIELPRG